MRSSWVHRSSGTECGPVRWTRREFLERVGAAGGAAAVYETMVALGMLRTPPAYAGAPRPQRMGGGKSVLILGAGIGGLTAACELVAAEYQVEVVEAADRIGGRSFTVRRDDVVEQTGAHARGVQPQVGDDPRHADRVYDVRLT